MKIKTQVGATLAGTVLLLILVAFGGYMAVNIVNKASTVYPGILVPGIQNYADLRYKSLAISLAVYQKDKESIKTLAEDLEPRLIQFGIVEETSPFFGNTVLADGLALMSETMLGVVNSAKKEDLSKPPSSEFLAAVATLEGVSEQADFIIQRIVDLTTEKISSAISMIVKLLLIVSVIAIVLSSGMGFILTRALNRGIDGLRQSFRLISDGDLTVLADDKRRDELGEIAGYFNDLSASLKSTISQLAEMMNTLAELSSRFRESGQQFQSRAQMTSDETTLVATAMTEMAATVREVAQNAEATSTKARDATNEAGNARSLVETSVDRSQKLQSQMGGISDQISQLKEKTESISSVIDVIQGIAEQTNLLALNAAIEAARAGEQGRGFAVVADEVRSLATRTGQSTQEIIDVIQALQAMSETTSKQIAQGSEDVENNAKSITDIETSLMSILENISSISEMNHQIATNSHDQSHVAEEMNSNVVRISDLSEENALQTEQINADINTIDDLTGQVRELILKFKY